MEYSNCGSLEVGTIGGDRDISYGFATQSILPSAAQMLAFPSRSNAHCSDSSSHQRLLSESAGMCPQISVSRIVE